MSEYKASRDQSRRPSHPGEAIDDILADIRVPQRDIAERIGISRQHLHQIYDVVAAALPGGGRSCRCPACAERGESGCGCRPLMTRGMHRAASTYLGSSDWKTSEARAPQSLLADDALKIVRRGTDEGKIGRRELRRGGRNVRRAGRHAGRRADPVPSGNAPDRNARELPTGKRFRSRCIRLASPGGNRLDSMAWRSDRQHRGAENARRPHGEVKSMRTHPASSSHGRSGRDPGTHHRDGTVAGREAVKS